MIAPAVAQLCRAGGVTLLERLFHPHSLGLRADVARRARV